MTFAALLYLGSELTGDDLASLARDWRRWRSTSQSNRAAHDEISRA
jgi:hypothetical protein